MSEPNIGELLERIYGSFRYIISLKGKGAERSLAQALQKKSGSTNAIKILSPSSFVTTKRQFTEHGGLFEFVPSEYILKNKSDINLDWLENRLMLKDISFVFLEASNSGLGGLPVSLENLEGIAKICKSNEVQLGMDATRLLSNCSYLGYDPIVYAKKFTEHLDFFWTSCSKELLVPVGGLIAVRTFELHKECFSYVRMNGMPLEPLRCQIDLANGISKVLKDPSLYSKRLEVLKKLKTELEKRNIPCIDPIGAFALYVDASTVVGEADQVKLAALSSELFVQTGMRIRIEVFERLRKNLMRVTFPLETYRESNVIELADCISKLFKPDFCPPTLRQLPPAKSLHSGVPSYERV